MKPPKFFNERWASKGPRPPTYFDTIGSNRLFRYNNGCESNGLSRFCKRFFFGLKKNFGVINSHASVKPELATRTLPGSHGSASTASPKNIPQESTIAVFSEIIHLKKSLLKFPLVNRFCMLSSFRICKLRKLMCKFAQFGLECSIVLGLGVKGICSNIFYFSTFYGNHHEPFVPKYNENLSAIPDHVSLLSNQGAICSIWKVKMNRIGSPVTYFPLAFVSQGREKTTAQRSS